MLPTLRLHGYWRSSCAYRVRIALAHKQLKYDTAAVDILRGDQAKPEYGKINPLRQVPVLELTYPDARCLYISQSAAICELLEELWPERPLMPRDPIVRAQVRAVCASVNAGIQPFQNTSTLKWVKKTAAIGETRSKDLDHAIDTKMKAWTNHFIGGGLSALEAQVKATGGVYCVGDQVTLADAFMVPQLWSADRFLDPVVIKESYPVLSGIYCRLQKLPAFVAAMPSAQPDFPQQTTSV